MIDEKDEKYNHFAVFRQENYFKFYIYNLKL